MNVRRWVTAGAVLAVGMGACSDGTPTQASPPAPTLARIVVTAPTAPLTSFGQTVQLTASGVDSDGNSVPVSVTWASSDPGVASIDTTGRATAVANGQTTIAATANGVTGGGALTVAQAPAALAFTTQPGSALAGASLAVVEVSVLDAREHVVTTAFPTVTLSLIGAGGTLSGTTAVAASGGVARFNDLRVDGASGAYALRADAAGFGAQSTPFDVTVLRAPFDDFQAADFAIGQADLVSGEENAGQGSVNAAGLRHRGTVATGNGTFYLVDAGNSRILGFNTMPRGGLVPANFVLGQADLNSAIVPSNPTPSTFVLPNEVVVADGRLLVSDFNSNRILIWSALPRTTNAPADVVVGQVDFNSRVRGTSRTTLANPAFFTVAGGRLFVSDGSNHRVLIWNTIPDANGAPADVVLGQPDFVSSTSGTSATSLFSPAGIWSDGQRLIVADYSNRRVLIWNSIPTVNQTAADLVIGAPDMTTPGARGATATSVGRPHDVVSDGTTIYVSDEENNRVLMFPFPTENGSAALGVLGQTDFTLSAPNDPDQDGTSEGVVSARTFFGTSILSMIGDELFVSDSRNARILVFSPRR